MILTNPACEKIGSFFRFGAMSGEALKKMEEQVDVSRSYDTHSVELCLNCISSYVGIQKGLFQQPANSGLSIVAEEAIGSKGIIDEVFKRRSIDIQAFEDNVKKSGLKNRVTLESASLRNIICKDELFLSNLQNKVHLSALFVFNLVAKPEDFGETGCKETRRTGVTSNKIICVIVPEKYREAIITDHEAFGIPLDKVIFVGDKKEAIAISYKDEMGDVPSCVLPSAIDVPDYETALDQIAKKRGNLEKNPLFIHMTRIPE